VSRRVLVAENQEVTGADLTNIGVFSQAADDNIVKDGIAEGNYYVGCLVSQVSASEIQVAAGRCYIGGKVYFRDAPSNFILATQLPGATRKLATVVVWGAEIDTDLQPRDFIINETTGQAQAVTGPIEKRRALQMDVVYGAEGTNPTRGTIASGLVPVCDITLTPAGIATNGIVMDPDTELQSAEEAAMRALALEQWRDTTGKRLDSMDSQIASLFEKTQGIMSPAQHRSIIFDVARLKRQVEIPQTAVGYYFDYFKDDTGSLTSHGSWLAKIEEGIRSPAAAEVFASIALSNPSDPKVKKTGDVVLPKWNDDTRISVKTGTLTEIVIVAQVQTINWIRKKFSRRRHRHGPPFMISTQRTEFYVGTYAAAVSVLAKNGELFETSFTSLHFHDGRHDHGHHHHREKRWHRHWHDHYIKVYWRAKVVNSSYAGSVKAQTFLNSNAGWLAAINLFFTQAAASGDVKLLLCECFENGQPDYSNTIAESTVTASELGGGFWVLYQTGESEPSVTLACRRPIKPQPLNGVAYGKEASGRGRCYPAIRRSCARVSRKVEAHRAHRHHAPCALHAGGPAARPRVRSGRS
jgi:hypothetical protein